MLVLSPGRTVATTVAVAALLGFGAAPAVAAVSAQGTLSGSGTSYSLRVVNTGDVTLERMTFTAAAGVEITGSDGPGGPTGSSASSFSRGRISIEPRTAGVFTFTTSAQYPPGAGGTLEVAANTGSFVRSRVTGPPAPPPPPPRPPSAPLPSLLPPLGSGDADGDSVRDDADLCPTTAARFKVIAKGCSLVDFIVSPAALLEDAKGTLNTTRRALRHPKRLRGRLRRPQKLLGRGLKRLSNAAARLRLNPCLASRRAKAALRPAKRGGHKISRLLALAQHSVVKRARGFYRKHPKAGGDADAFSFRYYGLAIERGQALAALASLSRLRRLMGRACKAKTRKRKLRARVVALDSDSAVARLSDGTTLVLGGARRVAGVQKGVMVEARGIGLKGDVVVANAAEGTSIKVNPDVLPCGFTVKLAPVQDFAQSNADILYYDARGYTSFGLYQLERGMGIGADRGAACNKKDAYFMSVFLDYRDTSKQQVTKLIGILNGVPGEEPAKIPNDVDPKQLAKLRFEVYGIDCIAQGCMGEQLETKSEKLAIVRKKGQWGTPVYSRTLLSVEDGSKTDFDTAILVSHKAPLLPGSTVFGVGYGIKNNKSTYPTRQFIQLNDKFAVHDDVPTAKHVGGLLWAYITGTRNGYPYYYWARLPYLVTDVVRYCPGYDSFYRLPWKAGTGEKISQGNNNPKGTHKGGQKYAFDFVMPEGTKGFAPRGGVVDFLVESRTANSNPNNGDPWVPGNVLRIKHQDGTFSWYEHMKKNGVYPTKGGVVSRGDQVIVVGNTGNSTNAHLHYHVTTVQGTDDASGNNASRGGTIEIRFQLMILGVQFDCVTPPKGDYFSTNAPPSS